ncbi:MAG: abortive infection family protein [candidate division KSB1 bacterium]
MNFSQIFDVYSRRNRRVAVFAYNAPITLRKKILLFCGEVFSNRRNEAGSGDYIGEFWNEVHQMMLYRHGRFQLMEQGSPSNRTEDAIGFLLSCGDEEFLDFIEYMFQVRCLVHVTFNENALVAEINEILVSENVGYELTEMVHEKAVEFVMGREREVLKSLAYPKVIRKDDEVVHATVIKPALQLLADSKFKAANQEYLEALEDYKKGDYGDCLTKCCSSFESVMKILCDKKGWPYKQADTASTLISIVMKKAALDSYFEQPLMIIATLRNRLSKSHGAGIQPKMVSKSRARFALNSTASAITFLMDEVK